MIKTVQRMLTELRIAVNENVSISSFPANYEISKFDDAQDRVCDELLEHDPLMLATYFDLTFDGSWRYYIPDSIPFNYETILMVTNIDDDATSPSETVSTAWHDRISIVDNTMLTSQEAWSIIDNYIEFPKQPASGTMRIWYTRKPVGFFYGTVGTGNSSTTVVFPATPTDGELIPEDDYYNGMKVYVNGQVRRITDYVRSTVTATITPAWSTTPTDSTSTVELISPLPDKYHQRIVDEAIRAVKIYIDDDDTGIARKNEEDSLLMKSRIGKRQGQTPKYIRHIPRV